MTTSLKIIGFLSAVIAILGLGATLFTDLDGPGGKDALVTMFAFQLVIGSFLFYGAHLKQIGSDLAVKVYPSSIAAMILFTAFAYRWFNHGL